MQKYSDVVLDKNGKAISGATVTVTTYPAAAPAVIYATDGGPAVSSVKTDNAGRFSFYAANGHYSFTVSGKGITTVTYNDVVVFDPADAGLTGFQQSGAGAVPRSTLDKLREPVTVLDFGAKGDGVTNDAAAVNTAQAAAKAIEYPFGDYVGQSSLSNLYGPYTKALNRRIQSGTSSAPLRDPEPILWATKFSSADRDVNASEWDNGAVYGALIKKSGAAYGVGVTGSVRHEAGTGQMIGVHGRGYAAQANAQVWGTWSYAYNTTLGAISIIGHEINIKNVGPDIGWQDLGAVGNARGLVIVTADAGATPGQHAAYVGKQVNTGGWYTGWLNAPDAIVPSNEDVEIGNGELYRLKGGSASANRYGGIRLHTGHFQYGLSMAEIPPTQLLSGCAILLAKGHKIVFGTRPTNGSYLSWTTGDLVNAQAANGYAISGTQVLGSRKTGWAAATGITDKTTFATYTAPTISAAPTQAEVQALANACQANSRHLAALINDQINHGLIGA
jgi:hypothetical protein